jgi:hypothetical protein
MSPVSRLLAFTCVLSAAVVVPLVAQGPPSGLPPLAASQADVQIEGELEVQYEDSTTGGRLRHFVHAGARRVELLFEGDLPPGLQTGSVVRARGRMQNDTLELSSGGGSLQVLSLASSSTFGEQRTLVMLVNFQDNPAQPYSWSHAYDTTFGPTSEFFRENSYGQTWLTGTVVGWLTLPMATPTSCDYYGISSAAEQAAAGQGINVSQYSRRIIAFPQIGACGWWGLGNVGGNPSRSWINGSYAVKVVAHELGHNLGDYHSKSQSCDLGGCSTSEYGDTHDIMGSPTAHFNAFQKERLGWLNYGASPPVQAVTASGSYWVDAMSIPGTNPKALRILKSTDGSGNRTWYYVEMRNQTGFDGSVGRAVLVHTGSESTGNSSMQIDLQPASGEQDLALDQGQTFTDTAIGLSIATVSLGSGGASISVTYPGAPCTMRSPSLSLSPGSIATTAETPVSFTLTVRNNDDTACQAAEMVVNAGVPSGWNVSVSPYQLTLAPGASGTAQLTVTAPAGSSGSFSVSGSVARTTTNGPGGSASATVNVSSTASGEPSALDVSVVAGRSGPNHQFTATVSAGGTPVAGAAVTFTVTSPTGAVKTLSATTSGSGVAAVKMSLKGKDPRGTYQVQATASSGTASGSAYTSFVY